MALLVIEGLDGAGKSTQLQLLQKYVSEKGIDFEYLHFPRTERPVFGDLVSRFLRGEMGDINQVNPYLVAMIYAGDRFDSKPLLNQWLQEGKTILLDRYVYSNIAYQCAKIPYPELRSELREWILNTEFDYFGLPKPDLNVFLDVPFTFTKNKLTNQREGEDRGYLNGMRDIHEEDLGFQQEVRKVYLSLETETQFVKIDCSNGEDAMLAPEEIFSKVKAEIEKRNIF